MHHDERLGHLLWEIAARVHGLGEAHYAKHHLSRSGVGILHAIVDAPGVSIAEITRQHPTTQQAVSQVVARLVMLGLVERRLVHGRTIGLYPTTAGQKAQAEGTVLEIAFDKELAQLVGRDKYDRLRKALLEVRPHVSPPDAAGPSPVAPSRRKPIVRLRRGT